MDFSNDFFHDTNALWFAIIPPITFIILNYLSYRMNLLKAMERGGNGNLGTVYFPISLLILVVLTFGVLKNPYIGAIGILVMGYGDGLAAVIGKAYGKHKFAFGKSIEGSLAMFIISFIVVFVVSINIASILVSLILALGVAAFATMIELLTPKGLDNLSVPLGSSFYFLSTFINSLIGGCVMFIDAIIGISLSFVVAILAYFKKSLNQSGLFTAVLLGTVIYMFVGMVVWGSLIAFFISSSLITKVSEKK